uniref:Uncharacterized protein n=1 Tax=Onchocerca volvulus TaxID=6282 RepID=A0A8R1XKR6_ONCVO
MFGSNKSAIKEVPKQKRNNYFTVDRKTQCLAIYQLYLISEVKNTVADDDCVKVYVCVKSCKENFQLKSFGIGIFI